MGQPSFTVYVDYVGTPHTFIKLDDGKGGAKYFGFAPSSAGSPGVPPVLGNVGEGLATHAKGDPHNKTAGYIDDVGWSKSISIDSKQYESMKNAVDVWKAAGHTYNALATLGGENCTTFVQAIAKAGGVTEIITSRASLPINLIPSGERNALFTTDADGRRSLSDALKDPLKTPGTPAYEFKRSNPELFKSEPNDKPTPDLTNSSLHQNKDGSFTEVVRQPDGDSRSNEYTKNGVAISSTQADGAKNDADYASRTTAYDGEGREDWRSIIRDDGTKWRIDFDQKNERVDKKTESATDAQGRVDWERVTQDDGSTQLKDHDQNGDRADRVWETALDAQGRMDWERVTQDAGAIHVTDYDQKGERGDRIWETAIDAQGRVDWERVTQDAGAVLLTDYDQSSERADRLWLTSTDAMGRKDWVRIAMDDGNVQFRDYDEKGERGDRLWVTFTDARGQVLGEEIEQDSGVRDNTYYDRDNSKPWVRLERHFDAQGREDRAEMTMDNGARNAYDYDQNGTHAWSRIETSFDALGRLDYSNRLFDDGSRLFVDNDFYGMGQHQLLGFNAAGQRVFFGSQVKGVVVGVSGTWNATFGEGLDVRAILASSGMGPSQQSPFASQTWQPEYDPYPNARVELGPLTPS